MEYSFKGGYTDVTNSSKREPSVGYVKQMTFMLGLRPLSRYRRTDKERVPWALEHTERISEKQFDFRQTCR